VPAPRQESPAPSAQSRQTHTARVRAPRSATGEDGYTDPCISHDSLGNGEIGDEPGFIKSDAGEEGAPAERDGVGQGTDSAERSRVGRAIRKAGFRGVAELTAPLLLVVAVVMVATGAAPAGVRLHGQLSSSSAVSYTLRPGFPKIWDTAPFSAAFTTAAQGDLVVAYLHANTTTSHVMSIQDSNHRITWHSSASIAGTDSGHLTQRLELCIGTVESVGSTEVSATWSSGTPDFFIYAWEFSSTLGAAAKWTVTASAFKTHGTTGPDTLTWPSLTSGPAGGLWVGTAYPGTKTSPVTTTPGFTYAFDKYGNPLVEQVTLAPDTAYAPKVHQTGGIRMYDAIAMIVKVTTGTRTTPSTVPANPARPSATAGNADAVVTWTAPTTGGSPITGYTVTSSGTTPKTCTWTSGPLSCTVSGLTNGTAYTFTVAALNGFGTSAPSPPSVSATPFTTAYDLVGADGGVFVFDGPGQIGGFHGSLPTLHIVPDKPIVGIVPTVDDRGYFLVGTDGGVFAFGTAPFLGSLPGLRVTPAEPIVGIIATRTDMGYYLVGRDGGVFAFGSVPFFGSLPGKGISVDNVIGIAATPSASGYWVVQATGTVHAFGNAQAFTTALTTSPVSAIAGTPTGGGYWLVTKEGGVYPYGNARKLGTGTLPHIHVTPTLPVIGVVPTHTTTGYWLIGADGGIFAFGTAPFSGSLPRLGIHVTDIMGAVPN
jgi:hypothetical protein